MSAERSTPSVFLSDPDVTLWHGDALETLRELPSESVHCIATSPPFYALRDYGIDGQIGLEATPEEWAQRLAEVFGEARRVLRKDGTLWVECGDGYAANRSYQVSQSKHQAHDYGASNAVRVPSGYKAKDLFGSPFLLAFALRADGWYWRGCNIWAKPNAMPESAKDRCTTAHSYVFHFAKSARYFFDGDAISEPAAWERWGDQTVPKHEGTETAAGWIPPRTKDEVRAIKTKKPDGWDTGPGGHGTIHREGREKGAPTLYNPGNRTTNGQKPRTDERRGFDNRLERADGLKHPRSVWTIPTQGFPEAHFATWPEALARRIILAACPAGGTVLDPFAGSGTTLYVSRKLGRRGIGIDLNADYLEMASRRLAQQSLLAEAAS